MAKENIAKFFDTAMTDKALAEKVAALAKECGYDFTAAELLEFGKARPLSDEEVAGAAGGWVPVAIRGLECEQCGKYRKSSRCEHCGYIVPGFEYKYS